jgi:hypothetical protein
MASIIRTTTEQGPKVAVGDTTLVTRSQAITVELPFAQLTWHRPTDVLVERAGHMSRQRLVDVTRALQLIFYGLAAAFFVISLVGRRQWGRR